MVVLDTVVVVVDSLELLELELDEEYPDDDFGDGVGALYGEGDNVRSTVRKMSLRLVSKDVGAGVGVRSLTALNWFSIEVECHFFRNSWRSVNAVIDSSISSSRSFCMSRRNRNSSKSL